MDSKELMSEIYIRNLIATDVPKCGAILRSLPQWFGIEQAIQEYEHDLASLDGYVALLGQQVVAFVGLKRYGKYAIEINVIGVSPDERRKGIGKRLLTYVENDATTPDTKLLHMKTLAPSDPDPSYAETRAFWESRGYIPMDAHLLWGDDNPCQVMVKPIP
jgi:N-acetylglutamate synthase-like GNAT family acetyltransferase